MQDLRAVAAQLGDPQLSFDTKRRLMMNHQTLNLAHGVLMGLFTVSGGGTGAPTTAPCTAATGFRTHARQLLSVFFLAGESRTVLQRADPRTGEPAPQSHAERDMEAAARTCLDAFLNEDASRGITENVLHRYVSEAFLALDAWKQEDRRQSVRFLMDSIALLPPDQPERTRARYRFYYDCLLRIGGAAAAEQGRRLYERDGFVALSADHLESHVRSIVERAFFDTLRDELARDRYDRLFGLLGELRGALSVFMAARPQARARFEAAFDLDLLRQRVRNGAMDSAALVELIRYVVATVHTLSAPAEDERLRAWSSRLEETIQTSTTVRELLVSTMPILLQEAFVFLRTILEQLQTLSV